MECKKMQDRLMMEYGDKELDPSANAEVERHLAACPDCREFFEAVQKTSVVPFKEAGELQPPEAVWQKIQERIETERKYSRDWFGGVADLLAPLFRISAPAFRMAFATALVLVVVVVAKWPSSYADPVYGYISEQMVFMNGLKNGTTDLMNGDFKDYDAALEEMTAQ